MEENPVARGAGIMWAKAKRDILEQIKRNQPVQLDRYLAGASVMTGLKEKTIEGYLRQFERAHFIRISKTGVIQMEEGAEAILGFK